MLDNNAIVEKSKKLIWSKYSKWSAGELAVFDTYLSRINARDPSTAEVVFTKREYEELMGLKEVRPDQLNRYIRNFIGNVVSIKTDRGWRNYPLFHKAIFEKNDAGEWEVTLRCNPELQDAFFALSEAGYQAYRLKYTIEMKSKYSKLLYGLLKDNLYRGTWQVDIKELRELIGATETYYDSFKEFNRKILKRCQEEISECTDIQFDYDKITKGRLTRGILFKIKKKQVQDDVMDGQIDIEDFIPEQEQEETDNDPHTMLLELLSEACNGEFNLNQIQELLDLAKDHVEYSYSTGQYQIDMYNYLRRKYLSLANRKIEKSKFGYMKRLVKDDL